MEPKQIIENAAWGAILHAWAKRSDYQQVKAPPLSHYTDAAGLIGICSSNTLWATCAQYSNDRSEVIYAQSVAETVAKEVFSRKLSPVGERFKRLIASMVGKDTVSRTDAHLTSFCESSDLLSQWRAYGRNAGFEIRFESLTQPSPLLGGAELVALETPLCDRKLLAKITYDPEHQRSRLGEIFERALALVEEYGPEHEMAPLIVTMLCALEFTGWLYTVKHPKFEEEKEWRAICFPSEKRVPEWQMARDVLSGIESPYAEYEHPEHLKFRAGRQHYVVPYCDLVPIEGKLPITEVICGPGGHEVLTAKAVQLLLAANAFPGVTVRNSEVPLAH